MIFFTNHVLAVISFCMLIYLIGWAFMHTFFADIFKKASFGYKLGFSWTSGNVILGTIFFYLAYFEMFTTINVFRACLFLGIISGVIAGWSIVNPLRIKKQLVKIIPVAIIAFFFMHLIQHSLTAYLIDWDATAMWFLKAKAMFIHDGIHNNPYFDNTGLFDFSNKAYPFGIPLIMAGFFKMIAFFDDQVIQFYFLQYFLLIPILLYASLKEHVQLSSISRIIIAIGLCMSPIFLNHAHSGYVDIPISLFFMTAMIAFMHAINEKTTREKNSWIGLMLLFGLFSVHVKNEGTTFIAALILVTILSRLLRRTLFTQRYILPITLVLGSILLWKYFLHVSKTPFYLSASIPSMENFHRLKTSIFFYLEVFLDTRIQSLTTIPLLLVISYQFPRIVKLRKYIMFAPLLVLILQLCAYTYIYLITPLPFVVQLQTSFPRLLLQLLPSLYLVAIFQQKELQNTQKEES